MAQAKKKTTTKATSSAPTRKASKKATNKTVATGQSVAAFIDAVENERRRNDAKTLLAMMKKITGKKPTMWGPTIIGFGEYHYIYESGREGDMPIVGFSPRKANMVLYVMGSIEENDPLRSKLGKYKTGSACLYVNKLDDVDLSILEQIIEKSYRKTIEKYG